MADILPDPLVPADTDLRGLEYMPLLGNHLFGSEFNSGCSDLEWRVGLTLWWAAWNQKPAGSLPKDDAALCTLANLGRDIDLWRSAKAKALRGFIECSDGRLYHQFLCGQVLIAWDKRMEERNKSKGEAERKRRERERRSRMFEQLRAAGVTPEWNITMADLQRLVDETPPVTRTVTHLSHGHHADVRVAKDAPDTAKTGRDVTGRDSTTTTRSKPRANGFDIPDWIPAEQWEAWVEMRGKGRKAPTDFAKKLAVAKLATLQKQGHPPADVLAQSVFHSWTGLFPVKDQGQLLELTHGGSAASRTARAISNMDKAK